MKKLLVIWLSPLLLFAQFSDDFSTYQGWLGDTAHYALDSLGALQLNAPPQNGQSLIWHPSNAIMNGHWEISLSMYFNTSGSNYAKIHLSSDSLANGYYLKVGGVDDDISLYKITSAQHSKIIDGPDDFIDLDSIQLSLLVDRDSIGNWQLSAKRSTDVSFIAQGQAFDESHLQSDFFGIECVYTQTRSDRFRFDNILVEGYSFLDTFLYPQANDIVINEVLFNPVEGDNDFVEIINRSDKTLCIKGLQLANYYAGKPSNFKTVSEAYAFMSPKDILVICSSKETLLDYHPEAAEDRIIEIASMPSYNNDEGDVVLALDSISIDEFHYTESMHFDLLQEVEGVSLERISTELKHWHSASEPSGFSTPTLVNSQSQLVIEPKDIMTLSPQIITPNKDGIDDILSVQLLFQESGYRGRLLIFDSNGFPVRTLVNNALFGTTNTYFWDGLTDRKEAATTGRYVFWLEAIHPNHAAIVEKQSVVVGWE